MTVYADGEVTHDRTYYGNGCTGAGSPTPCSTRIIKDGNNQDQKIGTYYDFQASTSGTGARMTSDSKNLPSPDTFCPLGWQLPYGGTGGAYYNKSRSWNYLFTTYNIGFDSQESETSAIKIRSYPFSYVLSGNFYLYTGLLHNMDYGGLLWSPTVDNLAEAYRFYLRPSGIKLLTLDSKLNSYAVRCVIIASLHRRHGGRNRYTNRQC